MLGFKDIMRKLSPLRLASLQLEEAQIERLDYAKQAEHYTAMERMLRERVARLRADMLELAQADNQPIDWKDKA